LDRGEIADEGEAGPSAIQHPGQVLEAAPAQLVGVPRRLVELPAREVVTISQFSTHMKISVYTVCGQA